MDSFITSVMWKQVECVPLLSQQTTQDEHSDAHWRYFNELLLIKSVEVNIKKLVCFKPLMLFQVANKSRVMRPSSLSEDFNSGHSSSID